MAGIKEDSLRHKAACGPQILTVNFIHTALVPRHQIQGYLPQTTGHGETRTDNGKKIGNSNNFIEKKLNQLNIN